jgi:glycosyltransferase involved in cell wall biosynthesis
MGGGSTTFTAHLYKAFEAAGWKPTIYRVKERGEEIERQFGQYEGVWYRNITVGHALNIVHNRPTIMSAAAHSKYLVRSDLISFLMENGMRIVVHDPNEFKIYDHLEGKLPSAPFCIRPTMTQFLKKAIWIPHPYMPSLGSHKHDFSQERKLAVSVARIASVKRPKIILEANRRLKESQRVVLMGAEYRMYTRSLEEKYGDVFKQSGKTFQFPMTFKSAPYICRDYFFNVDMTWFPEDGGGSQYAQMEAMDAGTVNIMHEDWFRYDGELKHKGRKKHVLTVAGPKGLAKLLKRGFDRVEYAQIIENGFNFLWAHDPEKIGKQYIEELTR